MKIFVTVGTTRFDSLIEFIDLNLSKDIYDVIFQISDGKYKPSNFKYFEFSSSISEYYFKTDLVITHAGAGSIYQLLEIQKKMIIVPNMERIDGHQLDIAEYMSRNKHALMTNKLEDIPELIVLAESFRPNIFKKRPFFKVQEILEFLQ